VDLSPLSTNPAGLQPNNQIFGLLQPVKILTRLKILSFDPNQGLMIWVETGLKAENQKFFS
jgi:hypothetical protein